MYKSHREECRDVEKKKARLLNARQLRPSPAPERSGTFRLANVAPTPSVIAPPRRKQDYNRDPSVLETLSSLTSHACAL